jgi:uncharacterized coiled-coil protein SlyX
MSDSNDLAASPRTDAGKQLEKKPRPETLERLYATRAGKVSDKWSIYIHEYSRLFSPYRHRRLRLLEIGVQNGGSLDIWAAFFAQAEALVGCDIDPLCATLKPADPRISIVVGDVNHAGTEERILAKAASFEIVIDDGSHRSGDICRAFGRYFPRLEAGGLYVVEDLHCSYWKNFEGGLFAPFSSMAFFKRLADVPNQEHWGVPLSATDVLAGFFRYHGFSLDAATLTQVHSVEFINSMCVVRKYAAERNVLGPRVVAGSEEVVARGHVERHGTESPRFEQSGNSWALLGQPPEAPPVSSAGAPVSDPRVAALVAELATRQEQFSLSEAPHEVVGELRSALVARGAELEAQSAEHSRTIDALGRTLARREIRASRWKEASDRHEARTRELAAQLAAGAADLVQLRQTADENVARLAATLDHLAQRDARLRSLEETVAERDRSITALQQSVQQRDAALAANRLATDAIEQRASETRAQLAALETALSALRQEADAQLDYQESLRLAIAARNERIGALNRALDEPMLRRWARRLKDLL